MIKTIIGDYNNVIMRYDVHFTNPNGEHKDFFIIKSCLPCELKAHMPYEEILELLRDNFTYRYVTIVRVHSHNETTTLYDNVGAFTFEADINNILKKNKKEKMLDDIVKRFGAEDIKTVFFANQLETDESEDAIKNIYSILMSETGQLIG